MNSNKDNKRSVGPSSHSKSHFKLLDYYMLNHWDFGNYCWTKDL